MVLISTAEARWVGGGKEKKKKNPSASNCEAGHTAVTLQLDRDSLILAFIQHCRVISIPLPGEQPTEAGNEINAVSLALGVTSLA